MRTLICIATILAGALTLACQKAPPTNTLPPVATQPAGPLDHVTNPNNQPGFGPNSLPR